MIPRSLPFNTDKVPPGMARLLFRLPGAGGERPRVHLGHEGGTTKVPEVPRKKKSHRIPASLGNCALTRTCTGEGKSPFPLKKSLPELETPEGPANDEEWLIPK